MRKPRRRLYWRKGRAYADFRDFADVGGRLYEPLRPGEGLPATDDLVVAQAILAKRLEELKAARRAFGLHSSEGRPLATLYEFAQHHLIEKRQEGTTARWLQVAQLYLERAVEHFGASAALTAITPQAVKGWASALASAPAGPRGPLTGGTRRHHLNVLSNLYARAQEEQLVPEGYNPVAMIMRGTKPKGRRSEARWLEVPDAALLLEAARVVPRKRADLACPFLYPLLATFLLTGGRRAEVLGLEVDDVSFDRQAVTFRPNAWRRLKTETSWRTVPLWPQLEGILRAHIFPADRTPRAGLLFPSEDRAGAASMVTNFDKTLDTVAARAGWKAGEIRAKMFRHTYCTARLQSLDQGAPVSPYTVGKELGHGGDALVRRIYGHLGTVRHRGEVVEYRVQQHRARLKERLADLRCNKPVVTLASAEYPKSLLRP